MSRRHLTQGTILMVALFALLAGGCAKKVVRPQPGGPPSLGAPPMRGPMAEQDLTSVQANLRVIYFDYDQYTLSPEAQNAGQYDAEMLKRAPHLTVLVEGHCDERGTDEYNLALGERRARSVAEYLTTLGVHNRLSTVSYGSELPVDPGHNEAAWAKNRRAVLRVSP